MHRVRRSPPNRSDIPGWPDCRGGRSHSRGPSGTSPAEPRLRRSTNGACCRCRCFRPQRRCRIRYK
ncbi:hypothetical protein [Lysobacter gummosus]|uniref:hypothetical protein n=1 Tax=Lysobacter gummosus TaxID=262324 RepID=UPI00363FACDA